MISGGKRWRRYSDSIGQLSPTAVNLTMPLNELIFIFCYGGAIAGTLEAGHLL